MGGAHGTGLSSRFDEALVYAAQAHRTQYRKAGKVPYVSHLLIVSGNVLEAGGSEDQAIAALLHDAAEDQGGEARLADIRSRFGSVVADIVAACSDSLVEGEKAPWLERKEHHIAQLRSAGAEVHLVIAADKLANARSMVADARARGAEAMEIFTGGAKGTLWYLDQMCSVLSAGPLGSTELVQELVRTKETLAALLG